MSFMRETLDRNKLIWDKCMATPFVQGIKSGQLPFESFREYMIQDSIYLKNYARVYGKAIYHAAALSDIKLYYSALSFVTEAESAVRLNYLRQFGMTDEDIEHISPLPENRNYIDFLLEIAKCGDSCEIFISTLPCMLSYSYIFRKIAKEPESRSSRYWDFIEDYADDSYTESCKVWYAFAEKKCEGLCADRQKRLSGIFERASLLELDFWSMVHRA